jgi:hypothetical protein
MYIVIIVSLLIITFIQRESEKHNKRGQGGNEQGRTPSQ